MKRTKIKGKYKFVLFIVILFVFAGLLFQFSNDSRNTTSLGKPQDDISYENGEVPKTTPKLSFYNGGNTGGTATRYVRYFLNHPGWRPTHPSAYVFGANNEQYPAYGTHDWIADAALRLIWDECPEERPKWKWLVGPNGEAFGNGANPPVWDTLYKSGDTHNYERGYITYLYATQMPDSKETLTIEAEKKLGSAVDVRAPLSGDFGHNTKYGFTGSKYVVQPSQYSLALEASQQAFLHLNHKENGESKARVESAAANLGIMTHYIADAAVPAHLLQREWYYHFNDWKYDQLWTEDRGVMDQYVWKGDFERYANFIEHKRDREQSANTFNFDLDFESWYEAQVARFTVWDNSLGGPLGYNKHQQDSNYFFHVWPKFWYQELSGVANSSRPNSEFSSSTCANRVGWETFANMPYDEQDTHILKKGCALWLSHMTEYYYYLDPTHLDTENKKDIWLWNLQNRFKNDDTKKDHLVCDGGTAFSRVTYSQYFSQIERLLNFAVFFTACALMNTMKDIDPDDLDPDQWENPDKTVPDPTDPKPPNPPKKAVDKAESSGKLNKNPIIGNPRGRRDPKISAKIAAGASAAVGLGAGTILVKELIKDIRGLDKYDDKSLKRMRK